MSDTDRELLGIVGGAALVTAVLIGTISYASHRPVAVVAEPPGYVMPPELQGAKVYVLRPQGHGQSLYVVVRDGQPLATAWSERHGKTTSQHTVETP